MNMSDMFDAVDAGHECDRLTLTLILRHKQIHRRSELLRDKISLALQSFKYRQSTVVFSDV